MAHALCSMAMAVFQEDKDRIPWPMQSDYGDSRHILRTQMAMDRMVSSAV